VKIIGWTADTGGCAWYRIAEPLRVARGLGHVVQLVDRLPMAAAAGADVVLAQYIADDAAHEGWRRLCALRDGPVCVYDLDDDIWSSPSYPPESAAVVERSLRCAHVVTCSTWPLAAILRRYNPNVHVVPNGVPGWVLDLETDPARLPRVDDRFTIGWPTSISHRDDLAHVWRLFDRMLRRDPNMVMHMIGPSACDVLPPDQLHLTPWQPLPSYYRTLVFDVLVAPLRPHPFNRSKSGIKAQEAAALGIPAVVTDSAPYEGIVEHGVTGFLVRADHEWPRYLRELHEPELRAKMGAAARARAESLWINDNNAGRWLDAWQSRQ
jgi:glycosyltransferase involved in cell wall biosynthesis